MVCRDDFSWCARMILWCAGMIKGETEGSEATRAVVEAAKAVAGGNLFCSRPEKLIILLENEVDLLFQLLQQLQRRTLRCQPWRKKCKQDCRFEYKSFYNNNKKTRSIFRDSKRSKQLCQNKDGLQGG